MSRLSQLIWTRSPDKTVPSVPTGSVSYLRKVMRSSLKLLNWQNAERQKLSGGDSSAPSLPSSSECEQTERIERPLWPSGTIILPTHHLSNMTGNSIILSNRSDMIKGHPHHKYGLHLCLCVKLYQGGKAPRANPNCVCAPKPKTGQERAWGHAKDFLVNLNQKLRNQENSIDQIIFIGPIIRRLFPI